MLIETILPITKTNTTGQYTPIEVKWISKPNLNDVKHILKFQAEYSNATRGYIVCNTPFTMEITPNIVAVPWNKLHEIKWNVPIIPASS